MSTRAADVTSDVAGHQVHPAFELLRSEPIEALNVTVEEYRHRVTGALHYHIDADNDENVFLVGFRTVPMDSTGVAHILEHTSLCGSKKYPVRDPFFMMIRRSLNTFMNAFTSSDWTAYPFASKNRKDFNNLMDVYLDAVFFTRLDELDFLQEGHRVEFKEADNMDSELEFKGVVFNEMKGAMSSPVSVLWQTVSKYLYPTTTYHYNSGGEPTDIPDLSYQQLKDFHATHYHPSNAVFMTFGNIPAFEHQSRFEEEALRHFDRLDKKIAVDPEKRYLAPVRVEESYSFDIVGEETTDNKTHHVMGWLLGSSASLMEVMRANLLSQVLLDNSSSPLRMALEKTDLGTSPSPLCGLEDSNFEMCLLCGLEGSEAEHADAFERLVIDVLQRVADEGIPQDKLEAVLHQIELGQREIGGDGYPYGLQLILGGLSAAIHRNDPVALLNIEPVIEELREEIKDPEFIKSLVRELLLDNQHRVRLTMHPDTGLSHRKSEAERERLEQMRSMLSDEDKRSIVEKTLALAERQEQEDDPEILPKVTLEDVPAEIHVPDATERDIAGKASHVYAAGTNGLVYQEVISPLPSLDEEERRLLPYLSAVMTEVGCGDKDYLAMQSLQSAVSGGISAHSSIRGLPEDAQQTRGYFILSGKALERNNDELAALMHETFNEVRFDESDRIKDVISQRRSKRERGITGSGHSLAMTAASSGISAIASLTHQFSGLEGIRTIKAMDDALKNDPDAVGDISKSFDALHSKLITTPKQYMLIGEEEKLDALVSGFDKLWSSQQATDLASSFSLDAVNARVNDMWVTNTQVNFCAKAFPSVTMTHDDAAALSVLAGFMRNGYLHTAIREKGGAYGGGASHDPNLGAFRFFSYRDPRLEETLKDFDRAVQWVIDGDHEWRLVEEAILGVIGSLDKPGSPAGEASHAYHNMLHGRTKDIIQAYRERVLAVTLSDLKRVAETYLKSEDAHTAVITSASTRDKVGDLGMNVIDL